MRSINQLAHSFPDLLHPFTILQSPGQAILWGRPELGTLGSDVTSQELGLNEAIVWKERTLIFPQIRPVRLQQATLFTDRKADKGKQLGRGGLMLLCDPGPLS